MYYFFVTSDLGLREKGVYFILLLPARRQGRGGFSYNNLCQQEDGAGVAMNIIHSKHIL